jgi:hypothetical protein
MGAFCSWCYQKADHKTVEHNYLRRNVCQCAKCANYTLNCRAIGCNNYAKGHPGHDLSDKAGSMLDKLKHNWHSEFCAEHDGTIASFERLDQKLSDIRNFDEIFKDRKTNMVKATTTAGAVVGGVAVFAATAGTAAPAYAAAMGKLGVLGAASTGTAISSLSGAALTSASLAVIGGGTVTSGVLFVTAAGAALGSVIGGVVSNQYVGQIQDFDILRYNEGEGTSIVFVNGFLNQDNDDIEDWRDGARKRFKKNPWYLITWESKRKAAIGKMLGGNATKAAIAEVFKKFARWGTKKAGSKINPLTWAAFAAELAGNDWHSAMTKASMTGILLADLIARTPRKRYILVGHSLGARVIYYTLEALSTRTSTPLISDAILLGGAIGAEDEQGWECATKAVSGRIYNCFSSNDDVLNYAYRGASALMSLPIGVSPITLDSEKIANWDCSELVGSHMAWKPKFGEVLTAIRYRMPRR